jgi:hypothetical protein
MAMIWLGVSGEDVHDLSPRSRFNLLLPVSPVILVSDEESDQHAGVHVLDVDSPKSAGVIAVKFL